MMLSLMYLLIFVVWAIAVIVLKCKNARAKREAEEAAAIQTATAAPNGTVHVIQIGSNYYDVVTMPPQNLPHCAQTQQQNRLLSSYPPRYSQYRSTGVTTPASQVNQGFVVDEGGIFPTTTTTTGDLATDPPPAYDEVMKVPKNYPRSADVAGAPIIPLTNQR